jgi:MoaA/NifB/PqqE/SkfB family radical SAM enzyme
MSQINFLPENGPRQFYFTPGYSCNSNCVMCGVAKWKRDSRIGFSFNEAKKLIDSMNLREIDAIEFSGGEPTIYPGFADLVSYTKEKYSPRVVILSHGRTLKNHKFVKSIVNTGIDRFIIPLFSSDPDTHDGITQVPGSFAETIEGFKNLEHFEIPYSIKFIAMQPNYKHALKTYKFKREFFKKARFIISGYQLMGEAVSNVETVSVSHLLVGPEIEKVLLEADYEGEVVPVFMFPMCHIDPSFWNHYGVGVWHEEVVAPDAAKINLSTELNYEDKHEKCKSCVMKSKCVWAWKMYVERYGSEELIPYKILSEE